MKFEVKDKLEKVFNYPFFCAVGEPLPPSVDSAGSWIRAVKECNSSKWENCRLMARNALQRFVEQRALARPAQIGAEQDADAFEFPAKHDGVVVCFRKMVPRFRVEHEPRAESIAAIDCEPVFRG